MPVSDEQWAQMVARVQSLESRQIKLVRRFKWMMNWLHGLAVNGILPRAAAKAFKQGRDATEADLGSSG